MKAYVMDTYWKQSDASNEYPQHTFLFRNKKKMIKCMSKMNKMDQNIYFSFSVKLSYILMHLLL